MVMQVESQRASSDTIDRIMQVVLEGVDYDVFIVPDCPTCLTENRHNNIVRGRWVKCGRTFDIKPSQQKPEVIFFGESISQEVRDRS